MEIIFPYVENISNFNIFLNIKMTIEFTTNGNIIAMLFADQLHDFFGSRGEQDQEGIAIKVDRDYMIKMLRNAWVGNGIINEDDFKRFNLTKDTNFQQEAERMIHNYNGLGQNDEGFQNIDIEVKDENLKYDFRETSVLLDIYLNSIKSEDNNINIHVDAVKRNRLFKSYMNSDIVEDTTGVLSALQRNRLRTKTNVYSTYVSGNLYDMANMDSMYKESIRTGRYLEDKSPRQETYRITDKYKNTITWTISKQEFWYDTILRYSSNYSNLVGNDKEYSKFIKKVSDYYNSDFSVNSPDVKHNLKILLKIYNNKILKEASDDKPVTGFGKKFKPDTDIKIKVKGKYTTLKTISGVNNFVKFLTSEIEEKNYRFFQLQCIKSSFEVIFNPKDEEETKLRMFEPLTLKQIPGYARTINEEASITYLNIKGLDLTGNIQTLLPKLYEMGGPSVSNIYKTLKSEPYKSDLQNNYYKRDKLTLLMCKTLGDLTVITSSFREGIEYSIVNSKKMRNALLTFDITCANIARSLSVGGKSLRPFVILQTPGGDYEFKIDYYVAKRLDLRDYSRYQETAVTILAGMEQNRKYENMKTKCDLFRDKLATNTGNFNLPSCDNSVEEVYSILEPPN